jgi:hypothetical protein
MMSKLTKKFLIDKFARRFVIGLHVMIVVGQRNPYKAQKATCICLRLRSA